LAMFRKDVGTYIKQYDFLSQLFDYEDPWLEKLAIYLKHLAPQLTDRVQKDPIDLSTVQLGYIGQHEKDTTHGKLPAGVELQPAKEAGTGVVRDPEMVAMAEIIEKINALYSGDHSEASVLDLAALRGPRAPSAKPSDAAMADIATRLMRDGCVRRVRGVRGWQGLPSRPRPCPVSNRMHRLENEG